jgi:cytolysin (calcineurin-like family phosphatase)
VSELSGVTTQVAPNRFDDVLNIDDWFGIYADEYDVEAVRWAVMSLANERLPEGITLHIDGDVFADVAVLDQLDEIEWRELVKPEELGPIAEQHVREEFK